jgi:hypothetical protein
MITDLLNSWYAMRTLLQQGIVSGSNENEVEELEAIAAFHDQCYQVAEAGHLDEAVEMATRVLEADPAGDFYRDLLEMVSTHGNPIEGDGWEGTAKTRLFAIPVVGPLENLSKLHHDERLVGAFRATGFADDSAHVLFLGASILSEGARMSPQGIWNLTRMGTNVLAQLSAGDVSEEDAFKLRSMAPLIDDQATDYEEGTHSGLLMGMRFDVVRDDDPIDVDPLDRIAENFDRWRNYLDAIDGVRHECVILSPMGWREGIVHSLVVAAQVNVLSASGRDQDTDIGKVIISSGGDHVDISWFDLDEILLGTQQISSEISFWALPEIIHELTEQGATVHVVAPSAINLATMPSPGRLLN